MSDSFKCHRCQRPLSLEIVSGLDRESLEKLARLVVCNECRAANHVNHVPARPAGHQAQPHRTRMPYADD